MTNGMYQLVVVAIIVVIILRSFLLFLPLRHRENHYERINYIVSYGYRSKE